MEHPAEQTPTQAPEQATAPVQMTFDPQQLMTVIQNLQQQLNEIREQQNVQNAELFSRQSMATQSAPISPVAGLSPSPDVPIDLATPQTSSQSQFASGPERRVFSKVPKSDPFSGERKKLLTFLAQMDIYAKLTGQFPDEGDKVLFATMLLKGKAAAWIQPYLRAAREGKNVPLLTSYPSFVAELTRAFGVIDEEAAAKRQLEKLRQKGSAHSYVAEFQETASYLEWGEV